VAELKCLRPGEGSAVPPPPWPDDVRLDETGLRVDSLDRMQLAAALAESLDVGLSRRDAAVLAHADFGAWLTAARRSLPSGTALVFRTSGSTGAPRPCRHRLAGLVEEAGFLATLFPGRRRVLATVPAHHIYGFLFTVLLPQALGCLPVEDLASPAELPALWRPGDLVVGFPDFWRAVARLGRIAPADVLGTTSTAPCPVEVALAVGGLGVGLTEIFGSCETAGLGWRRDPDAAFRRFPWWESDGEDAWMRRLPGGDWVHAPLPDRLDPAGDGLFRPAGRRDGWVQVGGINVSPAAVRACLLEHPWVADAAVRPMRPEEGSRLKAFVVPKSGSPPVETWRDALLGWIETRLPPPERPRALRFGSALPTGPMGKAADWDA
jgi:long-chain acyl-CoA synthetase